MFYTAKVTSKSPFQIKKRRPRTDDLTRFGRMLQGSGWQNVCNMFGDAILKYVAWGPRVGLFQSFRERKRNIGI